MPNRKSAHTGVQISLFTPRSPRPVWRKLPAEAQQAVTQLVAQLLNAHAGVKSEVRRQEGAKPDHE